MERYSYTANDVERFIPTPGKRLGVDGSLPDGREDFDRDRARVLHSAALRRLADKTQVVGPGEGDTPRTRLTHSLEVGQIARGIGTALGMDPDLCELAGLSHDIGHPPYGHNGEDALNVVAADCGGFEGNAQTLRILVRLEPKVLDSEGGSRGLNLTRASLDAVVKYPWGPVDETGKLQRKYSCYPEDQEVFTWVRLGAPSGRKTMEAQVMDWADDVAYSVHDVEDGILSGRVSLSVLWDLVELANLAAKGAAAFGGDPEELIEAAGRLREMDLVARATEFRGDLSDLVALKALTSELVSRFVTATVTATRAAYPAASGLGRYSAELIIPEQVLAEVTLLKSVAVLYVMDQEKHLANQNRQQDLIFRVSDYLTAGAPGALDPLFRAWWAAADSDAARLRVVVDQVASLTESRLERIDRMARAESAAWG